MTVWLPVRIISFQILGVKGLKSITLVHVALTHNFPSTHSQLRYDGFEAIASNLAKVVNIISACPPMARLHQVVNLGLQAETEGVS